MSAELNVPASTVPALTPRDLAAILFRHPRLISATFGAALLAALVVVLLLPRYESHFRVLLHRGRFDPVISPQPPGALDAVRPPVSEEEVNSEVELLRDGELLKKVVRQSGLVSGYAPQDIPPADVERAARRLARRLEVEALKKSTLIEVRYNDSDPDRAARVLSVLSSLYLERHAGLQRPPGEWTFFDRQTAEYEKRLRQSETALVNFSRARGVASAALERDIALQKTGDAEADYRKLAQDRIEADRRIASLEQQIKSFPARSVTLKRWADNPQVLEKMKSHLLELQLKRTELLSRFQPSYRLVREVEQQIADTRAAIAAEALSPVRDETSDKDPNYEWARMELEKAQVERDGLRAREAAASTQLASLRTSATQMQADAVEQQSLLRTAKAEEENYLLYLRKREEARIGDALDQQRILNVALVEPPVPAALPTHPFVLYFAFSFGFALAGSIGIAFGAEYFDATIRTPAEAAELLEAPVLAWLPASEPEILHPMPARHSKVVPR